MSWDRKECFEQQNWNLTGQDEIMDSVQQAGIKEHMKSYSIRFQMPTACVVAERKEGCKASCGVNPRGLVGWVSLSVHTIRCRTAKLLCSSGYTDRSRVLLVIFLLYFVHIKALIWDSPL